MLRTRRNNNTAPSDDFLPTSVGVRTPPRRRGKQPLPPSSSSSSSLRSDDSTPSLYSHFEESQQLTQNHEYSLDSPRVDGEDYETDEDDDRDNGIGNNLTTYMDYPDEPLRLYISDEDKHLIKRQVEELKKLINAKGTFTGVKLRTYDEGGYNNQLGEVAAAEEFEEAFIGAMMAQAGIHFIDVFKLDVLKSLCKVKLGKSKTEDEKKEHRKRTNRFLDGSRRFIKNQFKEKGEGAFDHAERNKGNRNKGKITMGTVKQLYLQEIFLEMSLNSIENDETKTLFMTEHIGKAIDIDNGDWTASNAFNKLMEEEKDDLLEAAKNEKKEEDKRKAREAKNIVRGMNDLQVKLQALQLESSKKEFSFEQKISNLQDENRELFQKLGDLRPQLRQARQDCEASNEMIQELKNENERLRQRITELEVMANSATITDPSHYYTTPLKDTNIKDETQSLHQHLTAEIERMTSGL